MKRTGVSVVFQPKQPHMTDPNAPAPEPLQFDRAIDAAADDAAPNADVAAAAADATAAPAIECSACNASIKTYYYHVDGLTVCAKCKQTAERSGAAQRGGGALIKAFLLGGVAAVLGAAIYYGVIAITNFEIGLVAILIGFMVGFGVRMGAAGGGGRRYQVMALVLTYFAVGLAYTPLAFKGAMDARTPSADSLSAVDSIEADSIDAVLAAEAAEEDSADVALAGDTDSDSAAAKPTGAIKIGLGRALLGAGMIAVGGFLMVFALPVIAVLGSLPSGLISAFIIGLGMHQAWKMTAGHNVSITGPYKVGGDVPAIATPEPEPAPAA